MPRPGSNCYSVVEEASRVGKHIIADYLYAEGGMLFFIIGSPGEEKWVVKAVPIESVTSVTQVDLPEAALKAYQDWQNERLMAKTKPSLRLPHSRACGVLYHEHGMMCSSDCPTCKGHSDKSLWKTDV